MKFRNSATTVIVLSIAVVTCIGSFATPHSRGALPNWASSSVKSVVSKRMMLTDARGDFNGNRFVTRYELAVALDRLAISILKARESLKTVPHIKTLHPNLKREAHAPSTTKLEHGDAAHDLIAGGFLPASSLLGKGTGTEPVTAAQTTDAMSSVTIGIEHELNRITQSTSKS